MNAIPGIGIRAAAGGGAAGGGGSDFDHQVASSSRDASYYENSPECDHEGDKDDRGCGENQGQLQLHEYADALHRNQRYSGGYQEDDDRIISGGYGYDFDRLTRSSASTVTVQPSTITLTQTQAQKQTHTSIFCVGTGDSSYDHSTQETATTIPAAVSSGAVSDTDADANRHVRPGDAPSSSSVLSAVNVTADAIVSMPCASTNVDADSRIPGSPEKFDASFLGSSFAGMFGSAEGSRRRKNSSGSSVVTGDMGLLSLSTTLFTPSSLRYRADRHHASSSSDRDRDRDYMQDKV